MIFQHTWQQVLNGTKTQTRRLVGPNEYGSLDWGSEVSYLYVKNRGRMRWYTGSNYAIQPGRGQSAVGYIVLGKIRQENLQDISRQDALTEGFQNIQDFANKWDEIHKKPGTRWRDNPEVWVLEFCLDGGSNGNQG